MAFGADSAWYGSFSNSQNSGFSAYAGKLVNNGGILPIPVFVFAAYELMFAIVTISIVSGAIADRAKFLSWVVFVILFSSFVYFPVAHWVLCYGHRDALGTVTGAGYLAAIGTEDFAGGSAVHVNAGAASLALVIILGPRNKVVYGQPAQQFPHSIPLIVIGTVILWFGWFGFTSGSALEASDLASLAFINTFVSSCSAMIGW